MDRARIREGICRMRFTDVLDRAERSELSRMEAAESLCTSGRTFRRWRDRHRASGAPGLDDRRLTPSPRRAPVAEIERMQGLHRDMAAHGGGETLKPRRTIPAHGGDGGGDLMHAEQIAHQRGQTLLGQQLKVQQIHDDGREAGAVLHRRGHAFGKGRACFRATTPANAGKRAMFRDDQRLRVREIVHLPRGMAGGHRPVQGATASRAGLGEMVDGGIWGGRPAQRLAGVPFLSTGFPAGAFAQTADTGGLLLQTIAGRGLTAVAAVQPKPTFQFGDPRISRRQCRQ